MSPPTASPSFFKVLQVFFNIQNADHYTLSNPALLPRQYARPPAEFVVSQGFIGAKISPIRGLSKR
jgi:hypothetical protein